MANLNILNEKCIIVVDDEPDVIESIQEVLDMCEIHSATSYEGAMDLLASKSFDIAILDIMGVNGYDLLAVANEKGITAVMLTAHAMSPDNFAKSMDEGACAYLPKDSLAEIDTFLSEIIEHGNQACGLPGRWFNRLKGYFESQFGPGWLDEYKGAWQ